jgi:outer membrane lipoprotein-sorting protein
LEELREHFAIRRAESNAADVVVQRFLAITMTPLDKGLAQHVSRVNVLIDRASGLAQRIEMLDADNDRTVITFSNVKTNQGLSEADVGLHLPSNVIVTYPLGSTEKRESRSPPGAP